MEDGEPALELRRDGARLFALPVRDRLEARRPVVEGLLERRDGEPWISQPPGRPLHPGAILGDAGLHAADETEARVREGASTRQRVRDDHLRRLRRGRGARVGGEVGERDVDLVPHGADHGDAARGDQTHEPLVVERREVLARSPPAPQDDHVDVGDALERRESARDGPRGPRALHEGRSEEHAGATPAESDLADIVDGRAALARDHADDARLAGERALAVEREEPFFRELRFQFLERLEERPATGCARAIGDELKPAPRRPEGGAPAEPDARAVHDERAHARRDVRLVDHAVDDRLFALVLQTEVDVAARRGTGARDLPLHDDRPLERAVQRVSNAAIELGHAPRSNLLSHRARGGRIGCLLLPKRDHRPRREVERQRGLFHGDLIADGRARRDANDSEYAARYDLEAMAQSFKKVLVANRGEIAVRIIRTLHEMGIAAVAVYSEADRASLHVRRADEAYCIGAPPAKDSYLRVDKIVSTALAAGCDAVHPGYGFLSENPLLAEECERAGLVFIGPPASAMRAMGSKPAARARMAAAGVPIVPGAQCDTADDAASAATNLGFPVMLKAANGGGGKGMRLVERAVDMANAWERARSEAKKFFGDDTVYVEKALVRPRHVEIQVLGDRDGNLVHVFERDCSIQRRNQKVVEETPSPQATRELVDRMGAIAVQGAKAVGYHSAGTFEFLLADDGSFYFLEMNTRLQVEHPITELVTGLDLVREMVRVAQGETLGLGQADLVARGAAIECRIYAEDPASGFLPSPGKIEILVTPAGPGVRDDGGAYPGCEISSHYDPLISKLSVWAPTRDRAIAKMRRALSEYVVTGIRTNLGFHERLFAHPEFVAGRYDTGFLEREKGALVGPAAVPSDQRQALAIAVAVAAARVERAGAVAHVATEMGSPLSPWVAHHRARLSR